MEMPKMVVFVVKRYALREAKKWRYAVRMTKIGQNAVRHGGVTIVVLDCGINFIRFMIPAKEYCNKSQKKQHNLFK